MQSARIATYLAAVLLLPCGVAFGQPGAPAPGRDRPGPPQVDPKTDEVLATISAAVSPTAEQMKRIVGLYTTLREKQWQVMREVMRRPREAADRPAERTDARPDGRPAFSRVRDARREGRKLVREKIEALSAQFLTECRALLSPEQLEAWDDCASGLDLAPRRGRSRFGGRGGFNRDRGPQVGQAAPDFTLTDLKGKTVALASLRGKPLVIEFGSYTCPVFRRQVGPIDAMCREFGDDVQWVLIYTREAHPTDGRVAGINTRQGIEIPQHVSFAKRLECAQLCKEKMGLEKMHLLVDGYDNKVTEAYAGTPNRGYVIDAAGKIVSRQAWINAEETRRVLKGLLDTSAKAPSL